ncbi:MAG: hypothetical protein IPI64_09470 [Chloracidobacterium sp.]|nr:hypothetical protein [Chloracidobacterium sp.]
MKRVEEKVKDIVEVRSFAKVSDFAADPAQTLASYHFTDITAALMAKWLDAIVNVRADRGAAVALAGFRGVGKSHFLASLAAIASQPELRNQMSDQFVAASAERLSRRHNPVAFVRRGSQSTLLEELRMAIAPITGDGDLSNSLNDLLLKAAEKTKDMPLVLLIDTALGRESRVSRDDGPILSEIAEAAKALGIFVGLALDDDIAGADGANLAITKSFTIDYLDQEHLYKIVDSHIFSKQGRSLPLLHEIYKHYASVLPGFRWSEQRFTSLYPLHPATLEIAPLIRLYLQDFALLGFAAEAGVKILGRPANSLIGLDEVFDAVENRLRHVSDLDEAFAAFDRADHDIIGKSPVTQRLQAKLILKGLFMLSLDGQGTTADEIAAAMLIFNDDGQAGIDIPHLLNMLAEAMPESFERVEREGNASRYCFKLGGKEDIDGVIGEAAGEVTTDDIALVLLRQASEKFSDLNITDSGQVTTNCVVEWRGAVRHGDIVWNLSGADVEFVKGRSDWTMVAGFDAGNDGQHIGWRLGNLTEDDLETIRRVCVLQKDADLREQFKDKLAAVAPIQSLAIEKIWQRVFLAESRLIVDGTEHPLTDEARSSHTLSQLFTIMLAPVFDAQFPEHPEFSHVLGVKEAARLIGQFFASSAQQSGELQRLAATFAMPLGLVESSEDQYVPVPAESLMQLPFVRAAFDGVNISNEAVVTLDDLASRMGAAPFGLTREAQHLVLAALVAQRQLEFVTSSGNRINQRSLDLQIIWDDIAGVAKPFVEVYSSERLRDWAIRVTGNHQIKSLDKSEDRLMVIDTLTGWLANWREARFLEEFEALPDESLNSSIWRTAANLKKTFGALADNIDALVQNNIQLDQCLHNITDLFSDSDAEFDKKKNDLIVLRYFTQGAALRDEVLKYLALCETTADEEVEQLRLMLLDKIGPTYFTADPSVKAEIEELWRDFKAAFADHYVEKHDAVMNSRPVADKMKEVLRSDKWSAFESFSDLDWFDSHFAAGAKKLVRNLRNSECKEDVRELLATKPFCTCSFSLARFERRQDPSSRLEIIINQGLVFFRAKLNENADKLTDAIRVLGGHNSQAAAELQKRLSSAKDVTAFTGMTIAEIQLLRGAISAVIKHPDTAVDPKKTAFEKFSDLLPGEVSDWEREIDNLDIFANAD